MIVRMALHLAVAAMPAESRADRREEWTTDLAFADELGVSRHSLMLGILRVAARSLRLRPAFVAATLLLVVAGAGLAVVVGALTLVEIVPLVVAMALVCAPSVGPRDSTATRCALGAMACVIVITTTSRMSGVVDVGSTGVVVLLTLAFAGLGVAGACAAFVLLEGARRAATRARIAASAGSALVMLGLVTLGMAVTAAPDRPATAAVSWGVAMMVAGAAGMAWLGSSVLRGIASPRV